MAITSSTPVSSTNPAESDSLRPCTAVPNTKSFACTLTALGRLAHRGAIAADGKSSDGVGVQTAVPRNYLLSQTGMFLRPEQPLAVGMLFLPHNEEVAQRDAQRFKACIYAQGFEWLGWRDVPIARRSAR